MSKKPIIYHGTSFCSHGVGGGGGSIGELSQLHVDWETGLGEIVIFPGWYLLGDNRTKKGSLGQHAIDFSNSVNVGNFGAVGDFSFCEGSSNLALGDYSHCEGVNNSAIGRSSHAEGTANRAIGVDSHCEGNGNTANGDYSHCEGIDNISNGDYSHCEGGHNMANIHSHCEGVRNIASGESSHCEGANGESFGFGSHCEGYYNLSKGDHSHAEGWLTKSEGINSHSEGLKTIASGVNSHAGGEECTASGGRSFCTGFRNSSSGQYSDCFGAGNIASGDASHCEGANNVASGGSSHCEGDSCVASGDHSHAEGFSCRAEVLSSHAEGVYTTTGTVAADGCHVGGAYNVAPVAGEIESIGGGTNIARKTIRSLFVDGTETYPESTIAKITARGNKTSVTVEYVASKIGGISPAQNSLLGAPSFLACTTTAGFSGRWIAEKVTSVRAATINNIGVSVYNSYGAKKIKLAIYSSAGALLGSTFMNILSASVHGYILVPLSLAVSLVAGAEYWLCVFGDGIDLPAVTTPANLNSTLSTAHCIEQPSATDIPASLTIISPQQLSTVAVPLWGG